MDFPSRKMLSWTNDNVQGSFVSFVMVHIFWSPRKTNPLIRWQTWIFHKTDQNKNGTNGYAWLANDSDCQISCAPQLRYPNGRHKHKNKSKAHSKSEKCMSCQLWKTKANRGQSVDIDGNAKCKTRTSLYINKFVLWLDYYAHSPRKWLWSYGQGADPSALIAANARDEAWMYLTSRSLGSVM